MLCTRNIDNNAINEIVLSEEARPWWMKEQEHEGRRSPEVVHSRSWRPATQQLVWPTTGKVASISIINRRKCDHEEEKYEIRTHHKRKGCDSMTLVGWTQSSARRGLQVYVARHSGSGDTELWNNNWATGSPAQVKTSQGPAVSDQ